MVSSGQLALLIFSIALFAAGGILSIARVRRESNNLRLAAKACQWSGVFAGLGVVIWHSIARGSGWPMEDNFDALLWLGLVLALFVLYIQRIRPIGGLEWFVIPIVIVLLIAAAVFGRTDPRNYHANDTAWHLIHRITAYAGGIAFAIAGAAGAIYLMQNRRLRNKSVTPGPRLGSLERLENLTLHSVTIGFTLLTIPVVLGILRIIHGKTNMSIWSPEVILGLAVYVIFAFVLFSPISPSLRGRKVAILSIIGCVLMIGAIVASQFTGRAP